MKKILLLALFLSTLVVGTSYAGSKDPANALCQKLRVLPSFTQDNLVKAGKIYQQKTASLVSRALADGDLQKKVCSSFSGAERNDCLKGSFSFRSELQGMGNLLVSPTAPAAKHMVPETFGFVAFNLSHYLLESCQRS